MTTPQALALADALEQTHEVVFPFGKQAATLIRTQHAEIERLTSCLKWEQNRAERIGTHGPGCESWGSAHYECLLRSVERKNALLRQALEALELDYGDTGKDWDRRRIAALTAIKEELQ